MAFVLRWERAATKGANPTAHGVPHGSATSLQRPSFRRRGVGPPHASEFVACVVLAAVFHHIAWAPPARIRRASVRLIPVRRAVTDTLTAVWWGLRSPLGHTSIYHGFTRVCEQGKGRRGSEMSCPTECDAKRVVSRLRCDRPPESAAPICDLLASLQTAAGGRC